MIAVVRLRPRALYRDSLCFFISESSLILKVDVIAIRFISPVLFVESFEKLKFFAPLYIINYTAIALQFQA